MGTRVYTIAPRQKCHAIRAVPLQGFVAQWRPDQYESRGASQ